jgi:hypothetical protein
MIGNSEPASRFSLAYTAEPCARVRLRIDTDRAVPSPNVLYGNVAMTCTDDSAPRVEHHYEIHHPPIGTQMITGTFTEDLLYMVRTHD